MIGAAAGALAPGVSDAATLAPSGTLRVGVVRAPTAGVFFVGLHGDGSPFGVTVDLGTEFGAQLGVPVAFHVFPNSGECVDAVEASAVDIGFMPVDASRAARLRFGPAYYLLESTYLVSAASGIESLADVDRPGMRVVGIADTTTIRASARSLSHVTPVPSRGVEEAIAMLKDGRADALALSRDSLNQIMPEVPGSRITPGGFQQTTVSIAVPPGGSGALAVASRLLEAAKAKGVVRRGFDAVGLRAEEVAP